jgi:hypothetical protein
VGPFYLPIPLPGLGPFYMPITKSEYPDLDSNQDPRVRTAGASDHIAIQVKDLRRLHPSLAVCLQAHLGEGADPDLIRVVEAWGGLPQHIKAAVLALIASASR